MVALPSAAKLAKKVRDLRISRRWTQGELATQLGLSQSRLSEIERGAGSFTAEQFLAILSLFNVTTDHFIDAPSDPEASLQNALARLGATQLRETAEPPSERLRDAQAALREVLSSPESPRTLTALAPVLVQNIDRVQLARLALSLSEVGLAHRVGWLVDNTLEALRQDQPHAGKKLQKQYRRAEVLLRAYLDQTPEPAGGSDVLDASIRSSKTLAAVQAKASPISNRWGIVSELTSDDFAEALRGARAAD